MEFKLTEKHFFLCLNSQKIFVKKCDFIALDIEICRTLVEHQQNSFEQKLNIN